MRRTKILATLGPSSFPEPIFSRLLSRVDAVRLNFSYGTDEEHRRVLRAVRGFRSRRRREIAIVADLQGPKIRLGPLRPPQVTLAAGQEWRLRAGDEAGDDRGATVSLPELPRAARPGDPVLLGDGNVGLEVERVEGGTLVTRVTNGGTVSGHAGVYLPRAHLRTAILGSKDLHDLSLALEEGIDYLALSFVRDVADIELGRRAISRRSGNDEVGVIAKIERAEALRHVDAILANCSGLMVARGDLGIEVPLERLAIEQKMLLARTRAAGKIGIVATQMLLSMVASPRPTRAEATDVANAVLDGADAVMLSEESAMGRYPLEAVEWLGRITRATEPHLPESASGVEIHDATSSQLESSAVADATVEIARALRAASIVTPTHSGLTATLVSSRRPRSPIIALSSEAATRRRLSLVWGVEARACPQHLPLEALRARAARLGRPVGSPHPAGPVILTAGYPVEGRPTNLVMVIEPRSGTPGRPRSRDRVGRSRPGSVGRGRRAAARRT